MLVLRSLFLELKPMNAKIARISTIRSSAHPIIGIKSGRKSKGDTTYKTASIGSNLYLNGI